MKKRKPTYNRFVYVVLLVILGYVCRVPIKLFWDRSRAISSYYQHTEDFGTIKALGDKGFYYYLLVEGEGFIGFEAKKMDLVPFMEREDSLRFYRDSLIHVDLSELINENELSIEPKYLEHGNYSITHQGRISDPMFMAFLKAIGIQPEDLQAQVAKLEELNCRGVQTHQGGIMLNYDAGVVLKSGCIIGEEFLVWYNLGVNSAFLGAPLGKRILNDSVQCFFR